MSLSPTSNAVSGEPQILLIIFTIIIVIFYLYCTHIFTYLSLSLPPSLSLFLSPPPSLPLSDCPTVRWFVSLVCDTSLSSSRWICCGCCLLVPQKTTLAWWNLHRRTSYVSVDNTFSNKSLCKLNLAGPQQSLLLLLLLLLLVRFLSYCVMELGTL